MTDDSEMHPIPGQTDIFGAVADIKWLNVYRRDRPGTLLYELRPGSSLYETKGAAIEAHLKTPPVAWELEGTYKVVRRV